MKTALITGASSGIGKAIAKILAKNNYNLIVCGRREDKLIGLCDELRNKVAVEHLVFDVRDREAVINVLT